MEPFNSLMCNVLFSNDPSSSGDNMSHACSWVKDIAVLWVFPPATFSESRGELSSYLPSPLDRSGFDSGPEAFKEPSSLCRLPSRRQASSSQDWRVPWRWQGWGKRLPQGWRFTVWGAPTVSFFLHRRKCVYFSSSWELLRMAQGVPAACVRTLEPSTWSFLPNALSPPTPKRPADLREDKILWMPGLYFTSCFCVPMNFV